jgi:hypothetical protein
MKKKRQHDPKSAAAGDGWHLSSSSVKNISTFCVLAMTASAPSVLDNIFLNLSMSQSGLTEMPAALTRLFKVRLSSSYLTLTLHRAVGREKWLQAALLVEQGVHEILKQVFSFTNLMIKK